MDKKLLPGSLRVKMLSLALKDFPFFRIDKYELNRRAVTYTYRTLKHFRKKYRGDSLYFIVGSDSLAKFRSWKKPEKILQNAELLVGRRKGAPAKAPAKFADAVHFLKSRIPDISSTSIRKSWTIQRKK
jgi:nicotinate-nucleotide adenylyltransferase